MAGWALFDTAVGPCGLVWNATLQICGGQLPEGSPAQIANDPQVKAVYLGDLEVVHA